MTSDTSANTYNTASGNTTGTGGSMGTTDTSAARTNDTTVNRDASTTTTTDNRYVQNEEAPGRSPFFYILLALIAFALISYAVKASRRNNPHHTNRQL